MAVRPINGLALCAGIGGLELGVSLAVPGYRTVCYVEREAHAAATLVAGMGAQALDRAPVWDEIGSFPCVAFRSKVDLISAGYPCQGESHAGKRLGKKDPRWIWPDIDRIVGECEPRWCFFENVPGHLSLGFEAVVSDLERMGYRVAAGLFSAAEVGAPHRRERLFVLADNHEQHSGTPRRDTPQRRARVEIVPSGERVADGAGEPLANTQDSDRWRASGTLDGGRWPAETGGPDPFPPGPADNWSGQPVKFWPALSPDEEASVGIHYALASPKAKPILRGKIDGASSRVDRLRACGNAVVPLVAAYALVSLAAALGCARDLGCAAVAARAVGVEDAPLL